MKIGICDDEVFWAENLKKRCNAFCQQNKITPDIVIYVDKVKDVLLDDKIDILILDIEMPVMSGISIKDKLESLGEEALIIFVTSHMGYVMEAFGKNVIGFIKKPIAEGKLEGLLEKAIHIIGNDKMIEIDHGKWYKNQEILYFEADHIYTSAVLTNGGKIIARKSITQWEKELAELDFIRTHKSYLVNLRAISAVNKNTSEIKIKDIVLPISRRKKQEFLRLYFEFCKKMGRYV
ncbi:MAG: LytTR family DNA-binding domain-containing protein [Anaerovoracaceae bacterium]